MVSSSPSVSKRVSIAFYSALLMSVLLAATAINLRSRGLGPEPASAAALAPATRLTPASRTPAATSTAGSLVIVTDTPASTGTTTSSPAATQTPTRTPTATPTPTLTPTATLSPTPTLTATPSLTPTATDTSTPFPTPGSGAANRKVCVPILMYHHIGYPPIGADTLRLGLTTSPQRFEEHLAYFKESNIAPISLHDLVYALALGRPLPEKRVIITIDDGYDDVYQYAFPLLQKYGFSATLFIPTTFVDNNTPGYMTWQQIQEMAQAGNDIQPHTKDHVDLRRRKREYLIYQILGSKQSVEAYMGKEAMFFAFPAGAYDDNAIAMLQEMNFWAAVSTDSGVVHSLDTIYKLKRLRVSQSIDVESMMTYMRFCGFE